MFSTYVYFHFGHICYGLQDIDSFACQSEITVKITNFRYYLDYIISYEVHLCHLLLILILYFIMAQSICFDRNVLSTVMFGDFINDIACIILQ